MLLSDKIRTFILAFCVPALFVVIYCVHQWFEYHISEHMQHMRQQENQRILKHFDDDAHQLFMLAQLYSAELNNPVSQQQWQSLLSERDVAVYRLHAEQLQALGQQDTDPQIAKALAALHSLGKFGWGAMLATDQPLAVGYLRLAEDDFLIAIRRLTSSYFTALGQGELKQQLRLVTSADIAVPEFDYVAVRTVAELPLLLQIAHQPDLFMLLSWHTTVILLLMLVGGLFIVYLGYVWLKRSLLAPFAKLTEQIEALDPSQSQLATIDTQGNRKFSALTDSINNLVNGLARDRARAKITLEAIAEAVIVMDRDALVTYMNPQAEQLLQVRSASLSSRSIGALLEMDNSLDAELQQFMASGSAQIEHRKIRFNLPKPLLLDRALTNLRCEVGNVIGAVMVLRDVTAEEQLKQVLHRRANIDACTGLLNRHAFERKLAGHIAHAQTVALCYLDLEQFKLINDNCGHLTGDHMLTLVAKVLLQFAGREALLGRLGGDEFGLVIRDQAAVEVARTLKALTEQVHLQVVQYEGVNYRVGVSIGVAFCHGTRPNPLELLKDADIACIAAKRKGSSQIHFYDSRDQQLNYERNAPKWAHRITRAIESQGLLLYFQPIRSLSGKAKRQRLEILLRLQGEASRILPPAQFIAAAERFKLMPDVDKEVIRQAFAWLSQQRAILDTICVSINLSANSLGAEGMLDYIAEQLQSFDLPSSCICFEITETSAMQNRTRALQMLQQLRKLGFTLALDDFGSGFASYGYLREMPIDYVKIDGCFVRQIATNARDFAIVKSIHDVCQTMGIETVAEFVESREIIDKLNDIGVNYAQGYVIGRPKPLADYQHSMRLVGQRNLAEHSNVRPLHVEQAVSA
ncbi:EAL domain-containing protein [Shewanella avicenniae]|uniref:EAL domain-containing protein n=1 Tax=Shewanella avicenniae TaxID=2814294 RepID=A0ABX7QTM1_9GAMM|nr:EAL domain-containing protein [Shewanella avicenniae]QSX34025.1 EAL domain-containing protein [Shewanella avicenniae]